MSGAQGSRTGEARFTPITVAGIAAILGLSGVLLGSVLQGGGGYRSPTARTASGSLRSQVAPAGTAFTPAQVAALSIPSGPPVNTTGVSATGGSNVVVATASGLSAETTAATQASATQASGSSQAATTVVRPATSNPQLAPTGNSQSAPAQALGPQFTKNVASTSATTTTGVASSAVAPGVSQSAPSVSAPSSFAVPTTTAGSDDSQPGQGSTVNGLSVPPGQDIQQVTGGAPGWGNFQDVWTPAMTGTGQWIIGPGGTAPADADPSKTIYLKPGQGAVQVNGTYVVYDGTGGVPGTLAYAP